MSNLAKYNPNGLLDSVFDDFLDGFFSPSKQDIRRQGPVAPQVKQKEDEDSYKLSFAAPGVSKNNFNVSLASNTLTLSYFKDNKGSDFFKFASFTRTWTVPDGTTGDDINADYVDGVLTVTINKVKAVDVEATTIEVN
jgi:HSP20 family protein